MIGFVNLQFLLGSFVACATALVSAADAAGPVVVSFSGGSNPGVILAMFEAAAMKRIDGAWDRVKVVGSNSGGTQFATQLFWGPQMWNDFLSPQDADMTASFEAYADQYNETYILKGWINQEEGYEQPLMEFELPPNMTEECIDVELWASYFLQPSSLGIMNDQPTRTPNWGWGATGTTVPLGTMVTDDFSNTDLSGTTFVATTSLLPDRLDEDGLTWVVAVTDDGGAVVPPGCISPHGFSVSAKDGPKWLSPSGLQGYSLSTTSSDSDEITPLPPPQDMTVNELQGCSGHAFENFLSSPTIMKAMTSFVPDGGLAENTGMAFALAQLQADYDYDESSTATLLLFNNIEGDSFVEALFTAVNETEITGISPFCYPKPTLFIDAYPTDDFQNYTNTMVEWNNTMYEHFAQYWQGEVTTVDNPFYGVTGGQKLKLLIILNFTPQVPNVNPAEAGLYATAESEMQMVADTKHVYAQIAQDMTGATEQLLRANVFTTASSDQASEDGFNGVAPNEDSLDDPQP
ncbi:expressed unknown protein [Seminavis robusta]|uniref:Uncharacterized protein n=1 Tax=Seminavis robusta TaxID=568900 RepID=A0A9N8EK68_9STRA|nr:expressed unknown protein [Seminavis robusta]|eukprot:Sro1320_g262430.1 n/a (519) ;mRNA; f:27312-28948